MHVQFLSLRHSGCGPATDRTVFLRFLQKRDGSYCFFIFIFINRFKSINEDAIFRMDFDHLLNQELIIKPGENSAEISVNVTEDIVPENNETFLLTLISLDKVTIIPSGSARITILNNGKTYAIGPIFWI